MAYKNVNIWMSENIKSAKGAFSYMKHEHITSKSAGMYCNMFILEALKCDQCGERGILSQLLKIYLFHLTNWTMKISKKKRL